MNHPPDDPSDFDAPPTRALLPTEVDLDLPGPPGDSEGTLEADTRRFTDGVGGRPIESGLPGSGPWTVAQLAPQPSSPGGSSAGSGSGSAGGTGSSLRGVVGRIEPGQTLYAKYRVLRRLGGGAMGDVWLVRHVTLKSEHALKVIIPNIASNGVALMRFQREFEIMASLRHEHAVSIYDACIDADGGYIDMEFVEGRTIHEVLVEARNRPGRDRTAPLMSLEWGRPGARPALRRPPGRAREGGRPPRPQAGQHDAARRAGSRARSTSRSSTSGSPRSATTPTTSSTRARPRGSSRPSASSAPPRSGAPSRP